MDIRNIAVIGSGVMGAGIAAHAANAGCDVLLLDIVPKDAEDRNVLAKKAIEKQLASGGFTHPSNARRVVPGNLEDDLEQLAEADWIIEAVLEKLEVKHDVYRKINSVRRKGSVVSSNTSTLPLHELVSGFDKGFASDFMIAHFFNPPRHMRLLEVVAGKGMKRRTYEDIVQFADVQLGKQVVECKDTPGFIANRIGVFWMVVGLLEAMRLGLTVEEADAVMGRPVGIPKTGVFGLYDLIGIDLIPLIARAMIDNLPADDAFCRIYEQPALVARMVAEGYTGRKGKGGFYRLSKQGEKKVKEVIDLQSGEYRPEDAEVALESVKAAKAGVSALVNHPDKGGQYAWAVLSATLAYAASLIPEIADDIVSVDEAMKTGYSWKYGPFELLDAIGVDVFTARLEKEGRPVPKLLAAARGRSLYAEKNGLRQYMQLKGSYAPVEQAQGHLWLADLKRGAKPVLTNASANLWDMGSGIACFEINTKMNAVDAGVLELLEQTLSHVPKHFDGLVIGNDTGQFSAGANLHYFLERAKAEDWEAVDAVIRRGQEAYAELKYAPFATVAALAGLALGGGCELVLHSFAAVAHIESSPGLVEVNVGLIPAWGGCTEMLLRHRDALKVFELVIGAKTASSAQEAREMRVLREGDFVCMNRARVLADARVRCRELAKGYTPPAPVTFAAGGTVAKQAMLDALTRRSEEGKASPHDVVIGRVLAHVLSGGETSGQMTEQKLRALEREGFIELLRTSASQERIAHMLANGKPLKN